MAGSGGGKGKKRWHKASDLDISLLLGFAGSRLCGILIRSAQRRS